MTKVIWSFFWIAARRVLLAWPRKALKEVRPDMANVEVLCPVEWEGRDNLMPVVVNWRVWAAVFVYYTINYDVAYTNLCYILTSNNTDPHGA